MGVGASCCVTGDDPQTQYNKRASVSETEPLTKSSKFEWDKERKIQLKAGCSFGKPLISTNNELLFVSSADNCISTVLYNLKTKTYNESQDIKCNDKSFDIEQCEYTFDSKNNSIYFINNNNEIMTLALNTTQITFNQNITVNNNKYAHIEKIQNKIYILGTEDDDKKSNENDNFTFIPYDAYKVKQNDKIALLQNGFGAKAVTIAATVGNTDFIYIIGGLVKEHKEAIPAPCDVIWVFNVSLANKSGIVQKKVNESKWSKRYLFARIISFGIINYKNKYLITFGGFHYNIKKDKTFALSNRIYILDLEDGEWYRINKRLQSKGKYFAVYIDDGSYNSNFVHLFSYRGKHFTVKINDILNELRNGQCCKLNDNWTVQGKTVLPTKSKSVVNLGPKMDDEDEDDD